MKQLVRGTAVYLPVWTAGALFSIGDAHFAQGDGEVCGSAIEMAATFHLRFLLHKGVARERNLRGVQFTGVERAAARPYYATTGLSMRGEDVQESEDATLAARNALLALLDYLQQRGIVVFGADVWASDWNEMAPTFELERLMRRIAKVGHGIVLLRGLGSDPANETQDLATPAGVGNAAPAVHSGDRVQEALSAV